MGVTFSLSYKKKDTDNIPTCASIVKQQFVQITRSLLGAERLKEIKPVGLAKLTAAYNSRNTTLDGFTCPQGELLRDSAKCGKFICVHVLLSITLPFIVCL